MYQKIADTNVIKFIGKQKKLRLDPKHAIDLLLPDDPPQRTKISHFVAVFVLPKQCQCQVNAYRNGM